MFQWRTGRLLCSAALSAHGSIMVLLGLGLFQHSTRGWHTLSCVGWSHSDTTERRPGAKWKISSPFHVIYSLVSPSWPGLQSLPPTENTLNRVTNDFLTFKCKGHFSVITLMPLLKYPTLWPLFPISNSPSLDPRTKTGTDVSFLPESSLSPEALPFSTCPFHSVRLQGYTPGPLYFIPCVHAA